MAQTTITIDATISGASSNSFLTLAECNALIHARPYHSEWDDITDDEEKNAALVWATRMLSEYNWTGYIKDLTQALPFPRTGLYDNDYREYSSTAYPEWLKVATSELAFYLIKENRLEDSGTEGFSEIKISSLSLKIDKHDRAAEVPQFIFNMVKKWIKSRSSNNATVKRV